MKQLVLASAAFALLVGCGKPAAPEETGAASSSSGPAVKEPPAPSLPDSLKHDAADYYGLLKPGTHKLSETRVEGDKRTTSTGEMITTLDKVDGGKATYEVSFTGDLSLLGTSTVQIDEKGVWIVTSSAVATEKPVLDLPADVKVGSTWTSDLKGQMNGQTVVGNSKYSALRMEKVKVADQEYDSLVVQNIGTLSINGAKFPLKATAWYVKGIGMVRQKTEADQGGKKILSTLELTK